jgi:hypothetical protein
LKNSAIFVIPAVNYDGYHAIAEKFKEDGTLSYLGKNRHFYEE